MARLSVRRQNPALVLLACSAIVLLVVLASTLRTGKPGANTGGRAPSALRLRGADCAPAAPARGAGGNSSSAVTVRGHPGPGDDDSKALVLQTQSVLASVTGKVLLPAFNLDYRGVSRAYTKANFSICPRSSAEDGVPACWLLLHKPVDCAALMASYQRLLQSHKPVFPPKGDPPPHLFPDYVLDGYIRYGHHYFAPKEWTMASTPPMFNATVFAPLLQLAKARAPLGNYHRDVPGIYAALDCHPVKGLHGAVFGTETPWMEAILLTFGAASLTTVEFRKTFSDYPAFQIMTPLEWVQRRLAGTLPDVDFAVSFSSWEHDGLGRYGDPVNPWGDVDAMQRASCYVKPGGLLFLGVPTSFADATEFNAHRLYGPARLPMMTANWEVVAVYSVPRNYTDGATAACGAATCDGLWQHTYAMTSQGQADFQPMIVLRNLRTTPCKLGG